MPAVPITRDTLGDFKSRLERLKADAKPKFGRMNTVQTVRHLRNAFEAGMGEVEVPKANHPFLGRLMYYIICYVFTTWPGGKLKVPSFWTPPPEREFDEERRLLAETLDRFVAKSEDNPHLVHMNPFFGPLTMRAWSRLNGIHLHHHLRQFGV